jgi:murein DD-endopeptidase MepM/ murein hydrolase activator NlpD
MSSIGPKLHPANDAAANATDDAAQRKEAATQLEAYLWRQVLAEVAPKGGLLDGGFAGSTFQEMFQGALADAMSASGGSGLAKEIEGQMGGGPAVASIDAIPPTNSLHRTIGARAISNAYPAGGGGALTFLPVQARRTSPFGHRPDPIDGSDDFHTGLDLGARAGTPIHAAGGGRVVRAEMVSGYGNMVVIDHGGGLETRYAHMQGFSVKEGDVVQPGTVVGQVGATGRVTGPHLHFEVRRDGHPVDPTQEMPNIVEP